jgi:hypothetical protein
MWISTTIIRGQAATSDGLAQPMPMSKPMSHASILRSPLFGRLKGNDVDPRGAATGSPLFPFPAIPPRLIFVPFRLFSVFSLVNPHTCHFGH